jgi:glycosyltransferase involved in cell wall biosynthesis
LTQKNKSAEQDILSVIIPITRMAGRLANLEKTFEECLVEKIEFILVHDEQDSETQIELEALLSKFKHINIRLFRKTFNSPGLARNYGVEHSTGSWFCFADSDDLPHISNLTRTAIGAQNSGAKVGLGNMSVVNGKHERLIESKYLCDRKRKSIAAFALNPAFGRFVFNSKEFKSVKFPKIKMGEDQVYVANTKFLDFEIFFSDLLLYTYFIDLPDQATKNKKSLSELPNALVFLIDALPGKTPLMRQFILAQIMKISLTCLYRRINLKYAIKNICKSAFKNPINAIYVLICLLKVQK